MKRARFEAYRERGGRGKRWRWRLVSSNGHILADSGESYRRRGFCIKAAERIVRFAHEALLRGVVVW